MQADVLSELPDSIFTQTFRCNQMLNAIILTVHRCTDQSRRTE